MDYFSWIEQEAEFSNAALTVRAQALPADDRDRLVHDVFFPRRDVDSVKVTELINTDFRPVADRREWNTRGRLIPTRTPTEREVEFIPVESYFAIEEREMQTLVERTLGNQALIRQIIGTSIPARVDSLVNANRRRLEVDAFKAWANQTITVMNPQTGATTTFTFGFDAGRYQTAGTAWNNGATNAYNEFLAWVQDGIDAFGTGASGVVLTRNIYSAVQADAPVGALGRPLTRAEFEAQARADLGNGSFQFYIVEHQLDTFTDAGLAVARGKVWPAGKIALVPAGVAVGSTAYAPVVRAYEIARVAQDADIDVRGMSVFREVTNGGRYASFECQVNAAPIPIEERMWVMATGIA